MNEFAVSFTSMVLYTKVTNQILLSGKWSVVSSSKKNLYHQQKF